jgi:hypothetical protein
VRHGTADLRRRLVLAQPFVDDLTKQVILRPGQVFDFGDKLGTHPMHAAQHERGAKPAVAWRRNVERHIGRGQRLQEAPQALKLGVVDTGPDAAGINQLSIRVVR